MKALIVGRNEEISDDENVVSVSCVNLRSDDGGKPRKIDEKIYVCCTICHKKKLLGKETVSMVRAQIGCQQEVFCDRCIDIFTEIGVYGSRVVTEAYKWELSSQVTRVAAVHEHMMCFRCTKKSDAHIYVKYYDVTRLSMKTGRHKPTHFLKVCGVCALEIVSWINESKLVKTKENMFPLKQASMLMTAQMPPLRRWAQ